MQCWSGISFQGALNVSAYPSGYRHLKIDYQKLFSSGRVYINGLEGFWSWAKERLMKHHGVSKARFPLYLKELEFRYNHRTDDLFDLIANYLCDLVPKQD